MRVRKDFIAALEESGLGLSRDGRVSLTAFNESWAEAFSMEARRLPLGFTYHHIGSTSIPGIHAKPILDILVEAPSLNEIDARRGEYEKLGYEWKGEYGIPGRRYCVLYNNEKNISYVHLHAFASGSEQLAKHLLFRDFLRDNSQVASEYAAMKVALARDPTISRAAYSNAKSPHILALLEGAESWSKKND